MAQFESGVKYVPYSQEQVFNKLSDLSNLESVRDKLADKVQGMEFDSCLLYTSPSPRDYGRSRMPSSA